MADGVGRTEGQEEEYSESDEERGLVRREWAGASRSDLVWGQLGVLGGLGILGRALYDGAPCARLRHALGDKPVLERLIEESDGERDEVC